MKRILTFVIFLSSYAFADCRCIAKKSSVTIFELDKKNERDCKDAITEEIFSRFKDNLLCHNLEQEVEIKWSCQKIEDKNLTYKSKTFSCQELLSIEVSRELLNASLYTTIILNPNLIEPFATQKDEGCTKQENLEVSQVEMNPNERKNQIRIRLKDLREAEEVLKRIVGNDVRVKSRKHKYYVLPADSAREIQGLNFDVQKDLLGEGYYLSVEYENNFYANNEETIKQVEENFGKVLLEKEKQGDAMYWSVGGGMYMLDTDASQTSTPDDIANIAPLTFRQTMSRLKPNAASLYESINDNEDQEGIFVETKLGKRMTLHTDKYSRFFLQGESTVRGASINEASFLESEVGAFRDIKQSSGDSIILGGGHKTRFYSDGNKVEGQYVEVGYGTKMYSAKFQYKKTRQSSDMHRNMSSTIFASDGQFIPTNDDLWELSFEYKW